MPKVKMKHYVCTKCGEGKFCLHSTSAKQDPPKMCTGAWENTVPTEYEETDAEMIHFLVDSDKPLCPTPL